MKIRKKFLHEKEYVSYFTRLIELERQEEIKIHKEEIKKLSSKEREKLGRCITNLRIYKHEVNSLGKYLLYLRREKEIKDVEIKEGDVVLLSENNPLDEGINADVEFIGKNTVILLFDRFPGKLDKRKTYRIDLYVNEVTYKRIKDALIRVKSKKSAFPLDVLFGQKKIKKIELNHHHYHFFNKSLNDKQKESVIKALNASHLYLIHGPPGTGKTTTLVEIALHLCMQGYKVLATADSNTAVDNFLEKFIKFADKYHIECTRVGSVSRIKKSIIERSLDYKLTQILYDEETLNVMREIEKRETELQKHTKPIPSNRRGLSYDDILKLSILKRGTRGIPFKKIKSMAKYIKLKREIEVLKGKLNKKREKAIREILEQSSIIFTTNAVAGSDILKNIDFDVVIIDEATQATEPSSLIPLVKSTKCILAGDHKQLPPTILSEKAKKEGLEISLFERFIELYPHLSTMLTIQYRMHKKIMEFPNKYFYGSMLEADKSISNHTLDTITHDNISLISPTPITFISIDAKESRRRGSTSLSNYKEAEVVKKIVSELILIHKPEDIGIITPYKDQAEILKKMILSMPEAQGIEIKTVDGFQGREKDIIILSLVRGNSSSDIGFLKDYRRLNVALTRARRKLIIIGNEKTLSKDSIYRDLINFIKREGEYILCPEIMLKASGYEA